MIRWEDVEDSMGGRGTFMLEGRDPLRGGQCFFTQRHAATRGRRKWGEGDGLPNCPFKGVHAMIMTLSVQWCLMPCDDYDRSSPWWTWLIDAIQWVYEDLRGWHDGRMAWIIAGIQWWGGRAMIRWGDDTCPPVFRIIIIYMMIGKWWLIHD